MDGPLMETARVRISKVTPKNGGASITILTTPEEPDDDTFIYTLVRMLDMARRGEVIGYAMVFLIEEGDRWRMCEAACASAEEDPHMTLGAIRRMERNFIRRTWPDEED
jgi:hypothetical protein